MRLMAATVIALVLVATTVVAVVVAVHRQRAVREATAALRHRARDDRLTGLPGRPALEPMLSALLADGERPAVLLVDLDGLASVNARRGHESGDAVVLALARRLQDALGDADQLVRYAGDAFVALCPGAGDADAATAVARRLIRAVEAPLDPEAPAGTLSASVGAVVAEPGCRDPRGLVHDAEVAALAARRGGRGRYALFDRADEASLTPSAAEQRLRDALDLGEFRLYYQPVVSLWTRRLVGVEALLRWHDPERGVVGPDAFVPALERTGLVVPVGRWVIEEVFRQIARWQEQFPERPALTMKVNVTARQLVQSDFVEQIERSAASAGVATDRLCLEIAEGALMSDLESSHATLAAARAAGVALALDDFGTGSCSLAHLADFGFAMLGIPKAYIDGLGSSAEDTAIVEHVIALAKALQIVTVAEGVQSEPQVEHLRRVGCDLAQGYYFSHPQPPHVIDQLLQRDGNRQEWQPPPPPPEDEAPDLLRAVVLPSLGAASAGTA
jgi:diguanylate cyclase (GGDEF)-like protein